MMKDNETENDIDNETKEEAKELAEKLYNDLNSDLNKSKSTKDMLINKFEAYLNMNVDPDVARKSIIREMMNETEKSRHELLDSDMEVKDIRDIDSKGNIINLKVKFVEEWDSNNKKIRQKGILKDSSGKISFTNWSNSNTEKLELNKSYKIKKVKTDKYKDYNQVHFQDYTEIEVIDDIDVNDSENIDNTNNKDNKETVEGMIVDVLDSSVGVYKECEEDNCYYKGLSDCDEHGDSLGEEVNYRVKLAIDNGENVNYVYTYGDQLDKLDFGLDVARSIVITKDNDALIDRLCKNIIFENVKIKADKVDNKLYAQELEITNKFGDVPKNEEYNRESFNKFTVSDLDRVESFDKNENEQYSTEYSILDNGDKISKVLMPVIVVNYDYINKDDYDYITLDVTDINGSEHKISIMYNDLMKYHLKTKDIKTPCEMLVIGKLKSYEEEGELKPTVNVEYMFEVSNDKIENIREL